MDTLLLHMWRDNTVLLGCVKDEEEESRISQTTYDLPLVPILRVFPTPPKRAMLRYKSLTHETVGDAQNPNQIPFILVM